MKKSVLRLLLKGTTVLMAVSVWGGLGFGAEKLPVEVFFKDPEFKRMRLSPDGKFLAAIAPRKGKDNLVCINLDTRKTYALSREKENEVYSFQWINEKRLIFEMVDKNQGRNGGLYAVNRDGAKPKVLNASVKGQIEHGARVVTLVSLLDTLDDSPEILALSVQPSVTISEDRSGFPDVVRINTLTGRSRLELRNPGNVLEWVTDQDGVVRVSVAQKDLTVTIRHRRDAASKWEVIHEADFRDAIEPLGFGKDPNILYVAAHNGDKKALFSFNIKERKLGKMIFSHAQFDVPAGAPMVSKKNDRVLGVPFHAERSQILWLDTEYKKYQAMIDQAFPGMANDIKNWSKKEDRILFHSRSEKTIGAYHLLDVRDEKKPKVEKIADLAGWIDPDEMSPTKAIQYKARDGLVIPAYLTIPRDSDGKNMPLIVYPHGGPWARDSWGWDPDVQFLANRGYAVLQPNFRGSTGLGKKHLTSGFHEWGGKMQDDITDGVKWLIKEDIADPKRVGIYGASYGGYAAMAGLCFTPELYRCGVNYVGVTEIALILKEYPLPRDLRAASAIRIYDKRKDRDIIKEKSILKNVDKIKAPVLMAYGMEDVRVPPKHGRALHRRLRSRGIPSELIIKSNEGHGFRNQDNVFEFYHKMDEFLARHMN